VKVWANKRSHNVLHSFRGVRGYFSPHPLHPKNHVTILYHVRKKSLNDNPAIIHYYLTSNCWMIHYWASNVNNILQLLKHEWKILLLSTSYFGWQIFSWTLNVSSSFYENDFYLSKFIISCLTVSFSIKDQRGSISLKLVFWINSFRLLLRKAS
jgi:lipopolysaccharide biosynthesis glycosyltransferase